MGCRVQGLPRDHGRVNSKTDGDDDDDDSCSLSGASPCQRLCYALGEAFGNGGEGLCFPGKESRVRQAKGYPRTQLTGGTGTV